MLKLNKLILALIVCVLPALAHPDGADPGLSGAPNDSNCTACHGGDGKGTLIGVPIVARPDSPMATDFILRQLRTPRQYMPDFPAEVLSDEKAMAIIDYIRTLETNAAASGAPVAKPSIATKPSGQPGGAD